VAALGEQVSTDLAKRGDLPHSQEAEASVVGQLLAQPKVVADVVGTMLQPEHFYLAPYRLIYSRIVESYYADESIDALVIAESVGKELAKVTGVSEAEAVRKVTTLAKGQRQLAVRQAKDHAAVVKKHSDFRAVIDLAHTALREVEDETRDPDVIAADLSQAYMRIATDSILTHEIHDFGDLGRRFTRDMQMLMAARAQGIELGAYFGYKFIDNYTRGLQPTELLISAGEPGAGKSLCWWRAARNFAERQMQKPEDMRLGTLVLSLEMGEQPSNARLAQSLAGIDGGMIREGTISQQELQRIVKKWKASQDIPLYFNFTSTLKASQMRALIVEAIRRHNIGVVVIDHFRYFDMDDRHQNPVVEDEEKARFLKEAIAKDLNIAVVCLAHTLKNIETVDHRPRLSHLRGSGQVAAHADFVQFLYRPYPYASQDQIDQGDVAIDDAESIWAKNRHGLEDTEEFKLDLAIADMRDKP
jgi:replicative DNA helicase